MANSVEPNKVNKIQKLSNQPMFDKQTHEKQQQSCIYLDQISASD